MYRFQKFARKHKPALATAAAIAACLILGTTVSAWQAVRATTAEAQANANEAQAQASAKKAEEKAQEATTQRDEAQKQRDEVKALADKLAVKEQQLQRTLYAAHMNLAQRAWDAGGIGRVSELLEQHRPKPGETDLRGFEWHYLYKLCHPELLMFRGDAVAFSPDGKRMAIGTNDSVKILDTQANCELFSLKGKVRSAVFSPDGKRLATAVRDVEDEVKVWDAQTGQVLHVFKGHDNRVWFVAFSPDGKRLASVGNGKSVIVRDSETGQELFALKDVTERIAFSPDGKRLASGNGPLKVWDAQTGHELFSVEGYIDGMAFSPDGKGLATLSGDNKVKVWDAQTGQELLTLKGNGVYSVAFSPDGKRLASFWPTDGDDWRVKLWDAQSGEELLTGKGRHTEQTNRVVFSPDGKRLASAAYDNMVMVWDAQTGDEILSVKGHTNAVMNVVFNHDGTRLASTSNDGTVKIWDVSTKPEASTFSGTGVSVRNVAFSPDGKRLASASRNKLVKVWDAQSGQELLSVKGLTDAVFSVAFSPDGKRLATGSGTRGDDKERYGFVTGEVKVWDVQTGRELVTLKGHTGAVASVAFSPDGTRLASSTSLPGSFNEGGGDAGEPGEVKVWDAQTGQELHTLKGHERFVNSVTFSPDSKRLATLSRDNTVKVWDAQRGQEILTLKVFNSGGGSVAFSPDGKRLASSNDPRNPRGSGEVKIWDAQTGEVLLTLKGHTAEVMSVAFSPDGKRLVTGTSGPFTREGGEMKLWDAETGEELLTFDKVANRGMAFSPDGHRLVSAETKGLKIYDATPLSEKPLAAIFGPPAAANGQKQGNNKNLLVNGSFEEGPEPNEDGYVSLDAGSKEIKGWVVTRGQIDYVGSYWQHADGQRSLDLHGTPGFGGLKQTFATKKGQKYRVTFSLAGNKGGAVAVKKLGIKAAGKESKFSFDTTGKSDADMGWTTEVWEFTATDNETTLELLTLMDEDPYWGPALDNVSVVPAED